MSNNTRIKGHNIKRRVDQHFDISDGRGGTTLHAHSLQRYQLVHTRCTHIRLICVSFFFRQPLIKLLQSKTSPDVIIRRWPNFAAIFPLLVTCAVRRCCHVPVIITCPSMDEADDPWTNTWSQQPSSMDVHLLTETPSLPGPTKQKKEQKKDWESPPAGSI